MSKAITRNVEQIWNERVSKKMKELGWTQRDFINEYKKKFKTGSQSDVCKWVHIGEKDSRSKKNRGFPEFETMRKIADILGVGIGYLIGETDYESFEMERVSMYLGLSSSAVNDIKRITSGAAIPPFYKYPDMQVTKALEVLLSSSFLVEYLKLLCGLVEIADDKNMQKNFDSVLQKIPEDIKENVLALWYDAEDAINNKGIVVSEEQTKYVIELDNAACQDMGESDLTEMSINAYKYLLLEANTKIINEILVSDKMKYLLRKSSHEPVKESNKVIVRNL